MLWGVYVDRVVAVVAYMDTAQLQAVYMDTVYMDTVYEDGVYGYGDESIVLPRPRAVSGYGISEYSISPIWGCRIDIRGSPQSDSNRSKKASRQP